MNISFIEVHLSRKIVALRKKRIRVRDEVVEFNTVQLFLHMIRIILSDNELVLIFKYVFEVWLPTVFD